MNVPEGCRVLPHNIYEIWVSEMTFAAFWETVCKNEIYVFKALFYWCILLWIICYKHSEIFQSKYFKWLSTITTILVQIKVQIPLLFWMCWLAKKFLYPITTTCIALMLWNSRILLVSIKYAILLLLLLIFFSVSGFCNKLCFWNENFMCSHSLKGRLQLKYLAAFA